MTDSTALVERLSELIEAARMYEASCRLGGKDQQLASRKLDKAKAAALDASGEDELVQALEKCRVLFREIRMDWSDPRAEIREGLEIIDAAIARKQDRS